MTVSSQSPEGQGTQSSPANQRQNSIYQIREIKRRRHAWEVWVEQSYTELFRSGKNLSGQDLAYFKKAKHTFYTETMCQYKEFNEEIQNWRKENASTIRLAFKESAILTTAQFFVVGMLGGTAFNPLMVGALVGVGKIGADFIFLEEPVRSSGLYQRCALPAIAAVAGGLGAVVGRVIRHVPLFG